jgi:hypothetical protein
MSAPTVFYWQMSLLTALVASNLTSAHPTTNMNMTVLVPEGSRNYGDPGLLCIPNTWNLITAFYFANYVAHAFTIKTLPGEKLPSKIVIFIIALFFPFFGISRGLEAALRCARRPIRRLKTQLGRANDDGDNEEILMAVRSKALCYIERNNAFIPKMLERNIAFRIDDAEIGVRALFNFSS